MKTLQTILHLRAVCLLLTIFSYHCGAFAQISNEQLHARLLKVVETFDSGSTATAILQAETLMREIGPLEDRTTTMTREQLAEQSYRYNVVGYLSSRMFWAVYDENPELALKSPYGHRAVYAADKIYRNGFDTSHVDDNDIVDIMSTLGSAEAEDGNTTAALDWYESAQIYVECAILTKGPEPELLWQKGQMIGSIVDILADTTDTERLTEMHRESLDYEIQGLVAHVDDPEFLWAFAYDLPNSCWWHFDHGTLSPDDVVQYANSLKSQYEQGLAPVTAMLYRVRGDWEYEHGLLRDGQRYYAEALAAAGDAPESFKLRMDVLSGMVGIAIEVNDRVALGNAFSDLKKLAGSGTVTTGLRYSLQCAIHGISAEIAMLERNPEAARLRLEKIISEPGLQMENADHFWRRSWALIMMVYLEDSDDKAVGHVRDLRELLDNVAAMDTETTIDHQTTDIKNLLILAEAKLHGHFWFDEPLEVTFNSGRDSEKIEWSGWDLYNLFEQAYWEADADTMHGVAEELLNRGVSEKYLENMLWLYGQ